MKLIKKLIEDLRARCLMRKKENVVKTTVSQTMHRLTSLLQLFYTKKITFKTFCLIPFIFKTMFMTTILFKITWEGLQDIN